jgi:hypothetical protein
MRVTTGVYFLLTFAVMLFVEGSDTLRKDVWAIDRENPALCHERHLCTPSYRRWLTNSPLYFEKDACGVLTKKGIKRICMTGDSYMRHMYQAFIMTVTGNYRDSPLIRSDKTCEYHMLFSEKNCSIRLLQKKSICNDSIIVFSKRLPDKRKAGDLILFSEGNHPLHGRMDTVNNASAYINHYLSGNNLCSITGPPSIISWVSTHSRTAPLYDSESPTRVRLYNEQMKNFVLSGRCGKIEYIDVYNMTNDLLLNFEADAAYMTFDKAHWGMEVNLVKAQMLLTNINDNPNINFAS